MGKCSRMRGRGIGCALAVIVFVGDLSIASPRSSQLIDEGVVELRSGRPEAALKTFLQASREDSKDSEAVFFSGMALNRLGRWAEALEKLTSAKQLDFNHPELPFEMGWSLVTLRRWDEAIEQLKAFEAQNPGRGQTAEFLGRAYLAQGKLKEADEAFTEALRRDPDLRPTVSVYRTILRQRQGDEAAARDQLSTLFRIAPNTPIAQLIGTQLLPIAAPAAGPWNLTLRTALGYNSDARGVASFDTVNLQKPPKNNSTFARFGLDTSYDIITTRTDRLSAGYDLLADSYFRQETDPDLLDQIFYLEWSFSDIDQRTTMTYRIWDNYTLVGEDDFRNEIAGQATFDWRILSTMFLEGSYRYAHDDYLYFIEPVVGINAKTLSRDAEAQTLTFSANLALPAQRMRLRAGYFHNWNKAVGSDFDYHSDGLFAGLTAALPWKITADALYSFTWDRYEHPNSASPDPTLRRTDDAASFSLRLTRPIAQHMSIYFEYDFNHDDSNIRGYDYDQQITSGGLIWQL